MKKYYDGQATEKGGEFLSGTGEEKTPEFSLGQYVIYGGVVCEVHTISYDIYDLNRVYPYILMYAGKVSGSKLTAWDGTCKKPQQCSDVTWEKKGI